MVNADDRAKFLAVNRPRPVDIELYKVLSDILQQPRLTHGVLKTAQNWAFGHVFEDESDETSDTTARDGVFSVLTAIDRVRFGFVGRDNRLRVSHARREVNKCLHLRGRKHRGGERMHD
jgi:hypothetical protein